MCKSEVHIVRPSGVSGDKLQMQTATAKFFLKCGKRLHGKPIVLGQRGNKAIAAVRAKPDCITGKQIFIVNQINHMPPRVTGNPETFNLDIYCLLSKRLTKLTAGVKCLIVWCFAADDAGNGKRDAIGLAVLFPLAHPLAVTPAIRAEQRNLFAVKL